MRLRIYFSFAFFTIASLVFKHGQAQQVLNVDIDQIKTQTSEITSENYYPTLLNRFIKGDTTLSSKQLHFLYYGKFNQPFYHPYDPTDGQTEMYRSIEQKEFDAGLIYGQRAFDLDPLDLKTLFGLSLCHYYLNNEAKMDFYLHLYYSLIATILETGNGSSEKDAFVVMSISDEYEIVNSFQKKIKKQKLINGNTDLLFLEKSKDKTLNFLKKLYFNIELPLLKVSSGQ
jgi:hypothetical protein